MTDLEWQKIRTEYVSKGTSYRDLCAKYGVNLRTMARRAKKENWQQLREECVNSVNRQCQQRAVKNAVQNMTRDVDRFFAATEKLMRKAEQLLDLEEPLSPRDLKALSGTLQDVKIMLNIRDDTDREEQKLRIEKMRAELESIKTDEARKVEVVFETPVWEETP